MSGERLERAPTIKELPETKMSAVGVLRDLKDQRRPRPEWLCIDCEQPITEDHECFQLGD